jgi:hypothetical protein
MSFIPVFSIAYLAEKLVNVGFARKKEKCCSKYD